MEGFGTQENGENREGGLGLIFQLVEDIFTQFFVGRVVTRTMIWSIYEESWKTFFHFGYGDYKGGKILFVDCV